MNPRNESSVTRSRSLVRASWRCLLATTVLLGAAGAQDAGDPAAEAWLTELLDSLNSGDRDTIAAFSGEAGSDAAYLWSLHQEFGPLSAGLRQGDAYWCHGDLTKAWVGLVVRASGSGYRLAGVRRGLYPEARPLAGPVPRDELAEYLDDYLEAISARNHFSGAVLVVRNGEVVFQGAHGLADRDRGIRNTVGTRFQLASITKMFIGVAISQLVERGELSFTDPISKFIPEYPQHIADQVTVHHLLTHTSGIEIDDYPPYNEAVRQAESIDDLLAAQVRYIEHLNLGNYQGFEPLGRFDYTNEGVDCWA